MYSYQEVIDKSLNYFDGDDLAAAAFTSKYALKNSSGDWLESSPEDMHKRLAKEFARIESLYPNPLSENEIFSLFDKFKYIIPQGSPMYGIGNKEKYISLSNCFVIESPEDSYGGIMRADEELVQISKRRGGVGVDISSLRPINSLTRNSSEKTAGICVFAERYSNSIREVGQNGRRGALMITLSVHHPEVLNFISSKVDLKKITGANISIRLTDEFMKAVENNEEYELRFPVDSSNPQISVKILAKTVWDSIVKNAWQSAEPGVLMWDTILRESPADCYSDVGYKTISTNPCAELPLSKNDSCRLMVANLYSFVNNPFTKSASFDFDKFSDICEKMQRLMDDLVDLELECVEKIINKIKADPEKDEIKNKELSLWEKIYQACSCGRRTGSGVVGLGDCLAALGIKYDSDEAINMAELIYKTLKLSCYRSSVQLAVERGKFDVFNYEKEKDNPFLLRIQQEDPELYTKMKIYGRRNISLLTIAPTGTVALMAQTTSGVEPAIFLEYKRRKKINLNDKNTKVDYIDQSGDQWQEYIVEHPKLKVWKEITGLTNIKDSPWYKCCAEDINPLTKVNMQAAIQKHCDHSISVTTNLPETASVEDIASIYMMAWKSGCKGSTVYRAGSRSGVIVKNTNFNKNKAPKRPQSLDCDIHHMTYKGEKYNTIVGLYEQSPYEVFIVKSKDSAALNNVKKSTVVKKTRGHYVVETDDLSFDINEHSICDEADSITRLISTSLRHGADINFVVSQLEKSKGDMMSLAKVIARVLKKYIQNGSEVAGDECPKCSGKLTRTDGCISCTNCEWSKC